MVFLSVNQLCNYDLSQFHKMIIIILTTISTIIIGKDLSRLEFMGFY